MMSKERNILLAVYGTLRRECGNNKYFLSEAEFKGEFSSEPVYNLYSLGGFPGLKEDGNTSVKMEVFAVNEDEALKVDALEGYSVNREPHFYNKKEIETPWGDAYVYVYVRDVEKRDLIESGDWLNRVKDARIFI